MSDDLVKNLIEIDLLEDQNFLKIRETLSRMGVANRTTNTLYQSCHILQKRGKYYIVHFKELLELDGRQVDMTEEDTARRNTIAKTLERWGLCRIIEPARIETPVLENKNSLMIVRFADKGDWNFVTKYTIGGKK